MKDDEIERLLANQQIIINYPTEVLRKIVEKLEMIPCAGGEVLAKQGDNTNDMYFILRGGILVMINDRKKAFRTYGETVGEMALVNPGAPRSATLIAEKDTLLGKISEKEFTAIASDYPELWRGLAQTISKRLLERNGAERPRNLIPRIFIGSSSENKKIVESLVKLLNYASKPEEHIEVVPWIRPDVFQPSEHIMETLEQEAKLADFAIMVLGADDKLESRKEKWLSIRDNVIFEMGLFMGAIGRKRTFLVEPSIKKKWYNRRNKLKIPTDLNGITRLIFDDCTKNDLERVSDEIKNIVLKKGQI